ncbi:MAG: hypothetical protein ABIG61_17850 [Planctomycetota bacterium]
MYYTQNGGVIHSTHIKLDRAMARAKKDARLSVWQLHSPGGYRGPDGNSRQWQTGDTPSPKYWSKCFSDLSGTAPDLNS